MRKSKGERKGRGGRRKRGDRGDCRTNKNRSRDPAHQKRSVAETPRVGSGAL